MFASLKVNFDCLSVHTYSLIHLQKCLTIILGRHYVCLANETTCQLSSFISETFFFFKQFFSTVFFILDIYPITNSCCFILVTYDNLIWINNYDTIQQCLILKLTSSKKSFQQAGLESAAARIQCLFIQYRFYIFGISTMVYPQNTGGVFWYILFYKSNNP